jgi:tetratricopeptide (TPR) repeat protein
LTVPHLLILMENKARFRMTDIAVAALACEMSRIGLRTRIVIPLAALALIGAAAARFRMWVEPRAAREARRAVAAGRYPEASIALTNWLNAEPGSSEAHLLKGRVAVALSNLNEGADELKRAHALGHPRDELELLQALIASKLGKHAEAEPVLRRAFEEQRSPDRQVDEAMAKVYIETYDLTRSALVLKVWARDFPDDAKPYIWWAEVHGRAAGEQGMVENDYRQALRREPRSARAHLGLADELRKAHRTAEAAVEYDACLALEPNDAAAHLGAGRNLMEHGDLTNAARHLNRVMVLDPKTAEPLKELAEAASRRGDWSAALALLDRAIALDPYDVAVRNSRGLALARLGRTDEARAEQAAAARLRTDLDRLQAARARLIDSPHDWKSQLQVARWMFDHAHDREGARWALKILAERPDDPEASRLLASYHERRGEIGLANFYRVHASTGPEPAAPESGASPRETP